MDPKTFAKLDPKLRETYERVMGTTIPQKPTIIPAPSNTSPPVATTPPIPSHTSPTTVSAAVSEQKTEPAIAAPVAQGPMHSATSVHTAVASPSHEEKKEAHGKTGAVPAWKKIMFIVLGITFFGVYAIFWLLFFKVKLPF